VVDYFLFLVFIFLFLLIGRGFIIFLNYYLENKFLIDNEEIFGLKLFYYYPIIGLFGIINFAIIYNFISPLNQYFFILPLITLPPNFTKKIEFNLFRNFAVKTSIISIPLLVGFSNIGLHYDAGLYHLNYQSLLKENKIIFGLSNLYDHYGFSSVMEYLHAMVWINENVYFIKYFQMFFFYFLFFFLLENILTNNNNMARNIAFLTVVYILLDNFGVGGGLNGTPNIQGVTKFDSIFSINFYIFVFMYFLTIKKNVYIPNEFRILLLFAIFTFQIRQTGIVLFIFILALLLRYSNNAKKIFFQNTILFLTIFFWIIKNLILTGCFLYPLSISCINTLEWSSKQQALSVSRNSKSYFINSLYEQELSLQILQNVFISLFIIFIVILTLKIKQNIKVNFDISFIIFLVINIYILLNVIPSSRFFGGFYLSLIPGMYYLLSSDSDLIVSRKIALNFLIFSFVFIPQINQYILFQPFDTSTKALNPIKIEYISYDDSTFVTPKIGDTCWVNPNCIPYQTYPNKISFYKYTMFVK